MQLTQKETMYLKDAKAKEELCIAKYTTYSQQVSCPQLSSLLNQIAQHERQHLQSIEQMMQGQIPAMGGSGGQQQGQGMMQGGQGQQTSQGGGSMGMSSGGGSQGQQSMQSSSSNSSGQSFTDQQICEDLMTTEKAVANLYNTATFEFTNPQMRQVLAHIQQEEQEHAYQLYNYMAQKGWYQAQ